MESNSFIYHKITGFKNIKVTAKLWKVKVVLPWGKTLVGKNDDENQSVWIISKVLN